MSRAEGEISNNYISLSLYEADVFTATLLYNHPKKSPLVITLYHCGKAAAEIK